jgi:hypothetical protein
MNADQAPAGDGMLTRAEFARTIKAKYPVYKEVPDDELVDKMLAKYPVYASAIKETPTEAKARQRRGVKERYFPEPATETPSTSRGMAAASQAVGDYVIGALKGGGETAFHLAQLARMVPGLKNVLDTYAYVLGPEGTTSELSAEAMKQTPPDLAASNTAQTIGKGAEQLAEVLFAGSKIGKAADVAERIVAPRLAPYVGQTVARLIPRAGVEAAGNAALSAAQGGDPRVGAVLGGAVPVVSGLARAAAPGLKAAAEKKVGQALGAQKERYKAIAERLAPKILSRGLGGSRESLQAKAAETLETVGDQLDQALTQFASKKVSTVPIADALETAKDAFRTTTSRGKVVEFEPRAIQQLDGLKRIIKKLGKNATVEQLTAVRRGWDRVVAQAGGYAQRAGGAIGVPLADASEAFAKREGASAIRKVLDTEVPEVSALNKEWSFWKNLDEVLTQTLQRTQAQGPGLGRMAAEAGGMAAGAVAGGALGPKGAVSGSVLGGKLAGLARSVFNSPRWKFIDARMRNSLADALMSGNQGRVFSNLSRIAAVEASRLPVAAGQ